MAPLLARRASIILCLAFLAPASRAADATCPPASPPIPASRLLYLGPIAGEYSDELTVRARLVDEAAAPMAARTIVFSFAGESRDATTGTDGIASAAFQVTAAPGTTPLVISFAGDAGHPAAQATATITIDRDETNLMYSGSPFLATGDVALTARLTHGNGDHAPLPVANRLIEFQLGTHVATAMTDLNGNASVTINVPDAEVGAASLMVRFAGDTYYRESQDSRSTFIYQRSSFVIWGGNAARPAIGQNVNFWGHSWSQQVTGGEYGAQSDFKGFATVIGTSEPCQANALLSASPLLTQGCWDSKPGQVPPPAQIARYISAIVSTAIAKDQDTIYGNIAARVILEVASDPPYGDDPGKPGYGKIVAVIHDGANLFPRPIIASTLQQPELLLPAQSFTVLLTLNNIGTAAASALNVQASFDGAMPTTGTIDLASLDSAESRSFTFNEQLSGIAQRGAAETTDGYLSRLASEDGRIVASQTLTRFSDVSGAFFSPVLSVFASWLRLPILAMRISGIACALPGSILPYSIELTNIGGAATASGSLLVTLPDGSTTTLSVPSLAPAASTVLNVSWTVPVIAPKAANETDAAYRARLASFDGKTLLLNGSLSWTDAAANQYGSTTAQFVTVERVPILSITAGALPVSATPGQILNATFTVQNLGSIASQPGRLIVLFPDATTTEQSVAALASGASTTLTATYTVPVVAAKGPNETDAAYRARLLSFDAQKLTFTGSLTWPDANSNSYGSISAQSESTERLPVLVLTAGALPASVLPNETFTPAYTIQNVGTGQASSVVLRIQQPDGTESSLAPLTIGGGQSVQVNGNAYTVPVIPVRASGESEAAYQQRLATFDNKILNVAATLNWADGFPNSYGTLSQQGSTMEVVPILAMTMTAPAEALSGDPINYAIALSNSGHAPTQSFDLAVTMPDGTVQRPSSSVIAAGGTTTLTLTFTIPENQPQGNITANALLRWSDARANLYADISAQATTLAKPKNLAPVVNAGPDKITALPSFQFDTKPTLRKIATIFNSPIGIDYHQFSNKVLMSVNYSSGSPYNLELVSEDGSRSRFSQIAGLTDELKIATAKDDGGGHSLGGFAVGEAFTGSGAAGVIVRIAPDGTSFQNPWVRLRDAAGNIDPGLMRGSLYLDRTGVWGGDLIAVTTTGGVFRVTSAGAFTKLAQINTHLEGLITIPNNPAKWGPWAGKILIGAEEQGRLYTVDTSGAIAFFTLGINPEDLDFIPANENFFGVDFGGSTLWGASASGWKNLVGDLLVTQESPGILWQVRWEPTQQQFIKTQLAQVPQWEHVTFAPTGIANIKPPAATVNLTSTVTDDGRPPGAPVTVTWSKFSGPGDVSFASPSSLSTIASFFTPGDYVLRLTASDTQLTGFDEASITVDPSNQPPVANAGADQSIRLPATASLTGSATDDAFPRGRVLTYAWSKLIGPGTVTFTPPNQAATTASFSTSGTYVLRLTVSDGDLTGSDDVIVSVSPENLPPVVNAGADQTITLPAAAQLQGQVTDDGKPAGGQLTFAWTQLSGPSAVSFSNPTALATSVSFTTPGTYVLRLSANDSLFGSADDVTITVLPGPSLVLTPDFAGPLVTNTTQTFQATLTNGGAPAVGVSVDFTVSGPNARTGSATTDSAGKASFSYAGAVAGTDAVQASATVNGFPVVSNTASVGWVSPVQNVSTTTVFGRFFTADGTGTFNTPATATPVFSQNFPAINFNAAIPGSGIGINTRPFTDVTTDINGGFTGTIIAQGNGEQAGRLNMVNFSAVFTGSIIVGTPGLVTFSILDDDGYILGIGNGATLSSGPPLTNPPANNRTPFTNLPVMAAFNSPTAPVVRQFTVNFPTAGTYPYELDYADAPGDNQLVMTMSTVVNNVTTPLPPTGTLTISPNSFPSQAVGVPVTVNVNARDGSDAPVPFLAVTLTVTGPNARQLSGVTDSTGKATFTYTGNNTGGDALQATASFTGMIGYSNVVFIQRGSNRAPTVDAGPDQTIVITNVAVLIATVTDDGLPLGTLPSTSWQMISGPTGVLFSVQGKPETTARFSQPGTYVLRANANDTQFVGSDDVTIIVVDTIAGNSAPVVNAGADQTITAPSAALLSGTATDDGVPAGGGLAITWLKVSGPGAVSFADPTKLSTTATFSVAGTYNLRLTASDTQLTANDEVRIVVNPGNQAPVVNAGADQTIAITTATLTGTATDDGRPNGTLTVSWSKVSGPGTVSFSTPTALTTTASFSVGGTYVIRLTASDSQLTSSDDVTITVNRPPVVNAGPDLIITLPNLATLNGTVTDDGVGTLTITWSKVSGPGTVTFTNPNVAATTASFSIAGDYMLRLTASDTLSTVTDDVRVQVFEPSPPPVVVINSPADGSDVAAPVDVTGSVDKGAWRLEYALQKGDGSANSWTTLNTGTAPVNGTLGRIDPTILLNGIYALRLSSTDASNQSSSITSSIVVSRNMKVGAFTLVFPDLTVPVAGLSIEVKRTYDSRDKRVGDFGVGWNLDIKNIRVQKSDVLGKDWEETLTPGFLPRYCIERRKAHVVTITFPDGRVYKFQAKSSPDCQQVQSITAGDVVFEQVQTTAAASGARLTVPDSFFIVTGSIPGAIELNTLDLEPFNPTVFTLTTREGNVYVIDQQSGLQRMTDAAGNTLTVGAGGITHSSGKSITFVRDSLGRITRITDPDGNALVYTYDSRGDLVTFEDREHAVSTYTYDGSHGLLKILDPNGRMPVRNEYDADGRLSRTIDGDGNVINYTHSLSANQEIVTDRLGNATVYDYDADGNVLQKTDALGGMTRYTFDAAGNKLTEANPLGQTTTNTYDANGNLTSVTDPLGKVKRQTFDANNRRLTSTDELGNVTTWSYDSAGNLTRQEDPLHNATTYTYDSRGLRLTETNAAGCTTQYQYDGSGNMIQMTDGRGNVTTHTYDGSGNRLTSSRTRTTPAGTETLVTTYQYDHENRLIKTTYPDGSFAQDMYDGAGQRIQHTDELGRRTDYQYNAAGDLLSTTYPDSLTETIAYDAESRRTATTDRGGRTTSIGYDKLGRITSITKPDGAITRNVYDAAGRLIESADPRGNKTTYGYDAAGRNTSITDPTGAVTQFAFDAAGNKISTTDPNGNTTTFTYDAMNRLLKTTFADGTFKSTTYDALGRKTTETDQAGAITRFEYDCIGHLVKVTDALGEVTTFTYDEVGSRTSQTDAEGRKTSFEYDKRGRMTRRTLPLGQFETRSYDAVGNVIGNADFNGSATTFTYDSLNRLTRKAFADGSNVTYAYTATGKPSTVTDNRGATTYTYDVVDRQLSVNQPGAGTISYTWDAAGNRTGVTTPAGTTSYTYDQMNRLATAGAATYAYDPAGNRSELRAANGTVTTYTYDRLNRLTQLLNKRGDGALLSGFTYTLGAAGNRTRVVESSGRATDWSYDAVYRLVGESVTDPVRGNSATTWTYDKVGNRLTENRNGALKTFAYDNNDRLLSDGAATYAYDSNGSMTSRTAGPNSATYQYDLAGKLKRVSNASSTIDYQYDASGIRVKKSLNGTDVTNYLIDATVENARALVETDAVGAVRASYIYGDDLLSMQRGPAPSFYLFDGQMSTRQLTDAAQSITDEYIFDAFGNLVAKTGSTVNDYLYTGEQFDANAGFYYLRSRYYDPASGRFISQDSVAGNPFEPLTLHKYAYVHNNPINGRDPSGQFSLAEMETTIQVMGVIAQIFPTLLRGYIIYKGVDVFFRPGFAMRNFGIEMFSFCASTQCFEAAYKLVESGNRLIVAGSKMIDWADKVVGEVQAVQSLLKTGYGFYELSQAIRNAPTGFRAVWFRYQAAARIDYLETDGRYLLQMTASIRIKLVYLHMESWVDYSEAVVKALKLLLDLRKAPDEIEKAHDLFSGGPELSL